jgi:hypothetical protein
MPRINVLESLPSSFDERRSSTQDLAGLRVGQRHKSRKIDNKQRFL